MMSFIRNLKIGAKIFVFIVTTNLLMGFVVLISIKQINDIGKEITAIRATDVPLLETLSKITFYSSEQWTHFDVAIKAGKRLVQDRTAEDNFKTGRKNFSDHGRIISQEIEKAEKIVEQVYKKYKMLEMAKTILRIDYELRNIDRKHANYQFVAERGFNLLLQGKLKEAEAAIQKIENLRDEKHEQDRHFEGLLSAIANVIEDTTLRVSEKKRNTIIGMLLFSVFILLFNLSAGYLTFLTIKPPLLLAADVAKQVANGERKPKIVVNSKDEIGMLLAAMKDMTEALSEADKELNERNRNLENQIAERKKAEEVLKIFAAKLEQSNQKLQDFAHTASHDLQEPLRKVTAFGDRLKAKCGDALSDQGRDYLDRMQNAARRMQALINGLLSYSRVTTKAQPFTPVDLNTVVQGVLSDLEVRIDELGSRLEVADLPTIDADALQMRQMFQNLIGNALKFHKQGKSPVVEVNGRFVNNGRSGKVDTADELYELTVKVNGIGLDE